MAAVSPVGLSKEEIRRIVLEKLAVVYREWNFGRAPFGRRDVTPGKRRRQEHTFETALVAALLGGVSEAIEKNNQALMKALRSNERKIRPARTDRPRRRRRNGRAA
ncbi:MAG TPA: hypothetical protein VGT40_15070 [Methylomirabilota bacterium]|jgi:hypothetical protein|nr:hypothetical protein [Methylomirabilota bacterium]